jgi:hypothetical protein
MELGKRNGMGLKEKSIKHNWTSLISVMTERIWGMEEI